jgi:hypothetical protein
MLNRPSVFDKIKEQLHEMKQDFTEMFPTTEEEIRKDYLRTRNEIQKQYVSRRLGLQEELKETKTIVKKDLQDIIKECRRFTSRMADGIKKESHHDGTIEKNFREQIRSYERALHSVLSSQAEANATIQSHLPPANELTAYYQSRPEMKELTLEKDLHRLQYTLYTHEGKKITEADQILDYEMENRSQATSDTHEMVWRAANQSLFGDVISCLTSEMGLVRPQLSSATFVDDCSIVIDLANDEPHVRAECFLNVSIPSADGERLSMAGVLVSVYFCPIRSDFRARVLHISPSPPLTEDEVQGATKSLCSFRCSL